MAKRKAKPTYQDEVEKEFSAGPRGRFVGKEDAIKALVADAKKILTKMEMARYRQSLVDLFFNAELELLKRLIEQAKNIFTTHDGLASKAELERLEQEFDYYRKEARKRLAFNKEDYPDEPSRR